jgi:shikimate kinase/3-dehydroquinate synthase
MRPLLLSGFMGTGKSTLGPLVAKALGVPFVDTDALLAEAAGRPTAELFAAEGEARFREREAAIVLALLAEGTPRVIALGGGAVTVTRVRRAALDQGTLVTLTASPETLAERLKASESRPNLGELSRDARLGRMQDLLAQRQAAYGECHATLSTEGVSPEILAERIVAITKEDAIAVALGTRSYAVEVVHDEPSALTRALGNLRPSSVIVVSDGNVMQHRGAWLENAIKSLAVPTHKVVLTPGEAHKTLASIERIWDAALRAGIDRQAVVVAFGGGVVGDLAAFAASTLLRGLRLVQVPTTLLSMVDSSVGGKTGFDRPEGKNLVGTFYQPSRVLVDLAHLATLAPRERTAGLAEVVKVALVCNAHLLDFLEANAASIVTGDVAIVREMIRAAIVEKARIVRDDEHEQGARALLNLGHTVGHALESFGGYATWLHGEAVAIGTVMELSAAELMGQGTLGVSTRASALFEALGLPRRIDAGTLEAAWPFVLQDKKRSRSAVRLPVIRVIGAGVVELVELEALRAALLEAAFALGGEA